MKTQDGWDIRIWIGVEEGRNKAEEIFDAIHEFINANFDVHESDGPCTLDWTLSMGPSYEEEE